MNKLSRQNNNGHIVQKARRVFPMLLLGAMLFLLAAPLAASARVNVSLPPLGTAGSFGVLAGSAVTNTGLTHVMGDLGVSPGNAISGFPPGIVSGVIHASDNVALLAQNNATIAYNNAAGQACNFNLTGQDLGGMTLTPGVYCFSSSAQLTGQLTLDGQGNPDSIFIFQVGSTLITASNAQVLTINGAQPCRIFWQVGSSATLGTDTAFKGNILALTSITLTTGATTSTGLYARNGAITLDTNDIQSCAQALPATSTPTTVPASTATATAVPATNTPVPAATNTPASVATSTSAPTNPPVPAATNTRIPAATNTPMPAATNTQGPIATDTPVPGATNTSAPLATNTSIPVATGVPTQTAIPNNTRPPVNTPTQPPANTAVPTNPALTSTVLPTNIATNTQMPSTPTMVRETPTRVPTVQVRATRDSIETAGPTETVLATGTAIISLSATPVTSVTATAIATGTDTSSVTATAVQSTATTTLTLSTTTATSAQTETATVTSGTASATTGLDTATATAIATTTSIVSGATTEVQATPTPTFLLPHTGGSSSWVEPLALFLGTLLLMAGLGAFGLSKRGLRITYRWHK